MPDRAGLAYVFVNNLQGKGLTPARQARQPVAPAPDLRGGGWTYTFVSVAVQPITERVGEGDEGSSVPAPN